MNSGSRSVQSCQIVSKMGLTQTRRRRSSQNPGQCGGAGADQISALPDDLLLLILAGLGCTAAAARTSGLSRRWRGLWASLGDISLRHVPFPSLAAVLSRVARPPAPAISLLEIRVPKQNRRVPREHWPARADVAWLLRAAARLAPERLVLALPPGGSNPNPDDVLLPCFHRAASIVLESLPFVLRAPDTDWDDFAALQTLHLLDCIVVDDDLNALLSWCPCLRVLVLKHKPTTWLGDDRCRTVHSETLEELTVDSERAWASGVDIVAPAVKQLKVSFWADEEMSISISAPMAERFWWHCRYSTETIGFGLWSLHMLTLQTQGELPSLQIYAGNSDYSFSDEEANLAQEIEKHMVIEFSDLELHLSTMGHVCGAFVLHLLQMNRIRSGTRRLKIFREISGEKEACPPNCPCEPTDWRNQIISLTALQEVEIDGFRGDDHEHDLLKLILSCAPKLRRMSVKLSCELSSYNDGCTKIYDIFKAYSSVECLVYLSSGLLHHSQNCLTT